MTFRGTPLVSFDGTAILNNIGGRLDQGKKMLELLPEGGDLGYLEKDIGLRLLGQATPV